MCWLLIIFAGCAFVGFLVALIEYMVKNKSKFTLCHTDPSQVQADLEKLKLMYEKLPEDEIDRLKPSKLLSKDDIPPCDKQVQCPPNSTFNDTDKKCMCNDGYYLKDDICAETQATSEFISIIQNMADDNLTNFNFSNK